MAGTFEYVQATPDEVVLMDEVRKRCADLEELLTLAVPRSRHLSLALTNLEQAAMWANKAITHGEDNER